VPEFVIKIFSECLRGILKEKVQRPPNTIADLNEKFRRSKAGIFKHVVHRISVLDFERRSSHLANGGVLTD
jgi:hypothetical protein